MVAVELMPPDRLKALQDEANELIAIFTTLTSNTKKSGR